MSRTLEEATIARISADAGRCHAILALAASLAVLGACAPGGAVYDKPGLTYAEWRRDDAECRQASLAGDERRELDREAYARCMRARGYRIRGD